MSESSTDKLHSSASIVSMSTFRKLLSVETSRNGRSEPDQTTSQPRPNTGGTNLISTAVKSQNTVKPNPLCRLPVTSATSRDVPFSPNSITPTSPKLPVQSRTPDGREFHTAGAATLKSREAKVVRTRGTDSRLVFADRRERVRVW